MTKKAAQGAAKVRVWDNKSNANSLENYSLVVAWDYNIFVKFIHFEIHSSESISIALNKGWKHLCFKSDVHFTRLALGFL